MRTLGILLDLTRDAVVRHAAYTLSSLMRARVARPPKIVLK
jgi:hypothetical protein